MEIAKLFKFSWFADLAYVRWSSVDGIADDPRTSNFERLIAAAAHPSNPRIPGMLEDPSGSSLGEKIFRPIAQGGLGWQLADFTANDPRTGFAASLFVNAGSNEKILAVRGTDEIGVDLIRAGLQEIGGLGMALGQATALFNYVQRLRAPAGAPVSQLELRFASDAAAGTAAVATDAGHLWVEAQATAVGLGRVAPGERVAITGHSLGGHLAALGIRLFPSLFSEAVTFNAPGFDPALGLEDRFEMATLFSSFEASSAITAALDMIVNRGQQLTSALIDTLFAPHLTPAPADGFNAPELSGRITSLVAESQAPGNDTSVVSSTLITGEPPSRRTDVVTEINSHSISQLVDALGVQALLEQLNPELDLNATGALVRAAAARAAGSEEALVDAIGQLVLADGAAALDWAAPPAAFYFLDPPEPFSARAALHERLIAIERGLEALPGVRLNSLLDPATGAMAISEAELTARAAGEIAYRYALSALNPFVVTGNDAIYAAHNANGALDLDSFSPAYLADRARLLSVRTAAADADTSLLFSSAYGHASFADQATGLTLETLPNTALDRTRTRYVFGAATDDFISGSNVIERSYGGDGADRIEGRGGADHLAGGRGSDILLAGPGADEIFGDAGADMLYANDLANADDGEPDWLNGGSGDDRYFVGDGDRIIDSDRQGAIFIGAVALAASGTYHRVAEQVYRHSERDLAMYLHGTDATLVAFGVAGAPRVMLTDVVDPVAGFRAGDLGITLLEQPPPVAFGNVLLGTLAADRLAGTAGADRIDGAAGDDDLFGGSGFGPWGADQLIGGPGNDYLDSRSPLDFATITQVGDEQGDRIDGGTGNDIAVGDAGDDQHYGDEGRDFLAGRDGADMLHGGPGDDVLAGGGGDDLLIGGAGDDYLFGAFDAWPTPARDWQVTPLGDAAGGLVDAQFSGLILGVNPPADDRDTLYGGAGSDLLNGGNGDDHLDGGEDADVLLGWRGDDTLFGGAGADRLFGDSANLTAPAPVGNDVLDGGSGDDELFGEAGDDILAGAEGSDRLVGGPGNDRLDGGSGNDSLDGGSGSDTLLGGTGSDRLSAGEGSDLLDGGLGDDRLEGGLGHDLYRYRVGDGHDVIIDTGGYDIVIIEGAPELSSIDRSQDEGHLSLHFDSDNSLTLRDWNAGGVDRLLSGSRALDAGGMVSDASFVDAATDQDAYFFFSEQGARVIDNAGAAHTLVMGDGIDSTGFTALVDSHGTWRVETPGAGLAIERWHWDTLARVVFSDGIELDRAAVGAATAYTPVVNRAIADQNAISGFEFSLSLAADTFRDGDYDRLTLSATLSSGAALPAWLSFDPDSRSFRGTPAGDAVGLHAITVAARDPAGHSANDTFLLRVDALRFNRAGAFDPTILNGHNGYWFGSAPPAAPTLDFGFAQGAQRAAGFTSAPRSADAASSARTLRKLAGIGDINGDGRSDLLVSENWSSDGATSLRHHVIFGHTAGNARYFDTGAAVNAGHGFELIVPGADFAVHTGDLDGDGYADVVLSPYAASAADHYVLYGRRQFAATVDLAADDAGADLRIAGPGVTAIGDYDADGRDDLRLFRTILHGNTARAFAEIDANRPAPDAGFVLAPDAGLGTAPIDALDPIGDFNGDGRGDFLAVTRDSAYSTTQRFYVVLGLPGGIGPDFDLDFSHRIRLDGDLKYLVQTRVGDFNHDGRDDFIVLGNRGPGAYNDMRVIFGRDDPGSTIDTASLNGLNGFAIQGYWYVEGIGGGDHGNEIASVGDVNGDGIDDIGLSERAYLTAAGNGHVPYIYGRQGEFPAVLRLAELDRGDGFYAIVPALALANQRPARALAVGDVNGDGSDDVAVHYAAGGTGFLAFGGTELATSLLAGTPADDVIVADAANTLVQGFAGNDQITIRSAFGSVVVTGAGNDRVHLAGEALAGEIPLGSTALEYARRNPVIVIGGPGGDTIIVDARPFSIRFSDPHGPVGNSIALGAGYSAATLRLGAGSILLSFGPERAEIHLEDFDPNDLLGGPRSIETLSFDDGTVLRYEDLMARGFDLDGSAADDVLGGTNLVDRIRGLGGRDTLIGRAGNDHLAGGTGDDNYRYARGDGQDLIEEAGGTDRVTFGHGITFEDLVASRLEENLVVDLGNGDRLNFRGWFSAPERIVEWFDFADGSSTASSALFNQAPSVSPIPPQHTDEDLPWSFAAGAGHFTDPDPGDALSFSASLLDDAGLAQPLPGWLVFDPAAGVFAGTPGNDDVGSYQLIIDAQDRAGETVSTGFRLDVANVNDPPEVAAGVPDQVAIEEHPFQFTVPVDAFTDVDAGDRLTLAAARADGTALPTWLAFDPASQTFSGAPAAGDRGVVTLALDAQDPAGASATTQFTLTTIAARNVFDGTPEADVITGTIAVDLIAGRGGDDYISAFDGDDVIVAGAGNDTIDAGTGNNHVSGRQGDDVILAGSGDDILDGGSGTDLVYAGDGNDQISGGDGDDRLFAGRGDNVVSAGPGDDQIFALDGDDRLVGGAGADTLDAGDGANDASGNDGDDLIQTGSGFDRLDGGAGNDRLMAGAGNDVIDAGSGDDTLDGATGNDWLQGGSGDDVYLFRRGDGDDAIVERSGHADAIRFLGDDVERADLWFSRQRDDLRISLVGAEDAITIHDWYARSSARVESLGLADGSTLDRDGIDQLVQAMAAFAPRGSISDPVTSETQNALEPILATSWQLA